MYYVVLSLRSCHGAREKCPQKSLVQGMTKYALAKAKDDIEGKIDEPQAKAAEANI